MDLDRIEEQEGPTGAEAAVDVLLERGDPPDEMKVKLVAVLARAGRYAEALRIALTKPSIFRDLTVLPALVDGCAATGNVELILKLGLMNQVLANTPQLMGILGGPLLRCAPQLHARGARPEGMDGFLELIINKNMVDSPDVAAPLALALAARGAQSRSNSPDGLDRQGDLPAWAKVALARNDLQRMSELIPALGLSKRRQIFPESRNICRFGTGGFTESLNRLPDITSVSQELATPELSPEALAERIKSASEAIQRLWQSHPAREICRAPFRFFEDDANAPVLVLSTGRAGTRSLNALLEKSDRHAPFHFFSFHKEAGDMNRLFYSLLRGHTDPENLRPHFERFLHDRLVELCWCAARGRVPVIVNHFELVHLPFYLALFSNLKIAHIHRDPAKTLISHAYKQQFRYQQIRPLLSREAAERDLFQYFGPPGMSLEKAVVWFMAATEMSASAAHSVVGDERYLDIDMDRVFGRDSESLVRIVGAFPDPAFTPDVLHQHFAEKINEKAHYTVAEKYRDPDRARDIYETNMAVLKEHGRYPDPE